MKGVLIAVGRRRGQGKRWEEEEEEERRKGRGQESLFCKTAGREGLF